MHTRPTGTVTFLFTDIEGSTRMWEEHHTAMRDALERHDDIVRSGIEAAGGYVFSTAGDAFAAAFTEPATAVESAIAVQRRLAAEPWGIPGGLGVRLALHTGVAHERDGDYFGPALNRAARMLAAGHGGQILLSLGTEEVLGDSLNGVELRDLGEHTLKDLGRPERIFQVVANGLRDDFPPLRSIDVHPNNLPIQLTSFVGRELELNEVVKRLLDERLLTLTGVGGSGKTRLAIQAAAESIADFANGVWLIELAAIGDQDLIAATIAETLGLKAGAGSQSGSDSASTLEQVAGHLKGRAVLLILDNCEHLIGATAQVVYYLLQHCPGVTVLATSREGLGVPGEALWQVPSLHAAVDGDPMTSEAVRLFVERAQDANARFNADPASLTWVQRICERLDGMPLAIELAAARARVLDARQIADRLDDRFRLLTGGSRTALPRHQTLEATVDWSYDLMSRTERILFRRLAAFRGGFTLEAAEAVCAGDAVDMVDVLDLLAGLVDKSMVGRDEVSGRFKMLETLRQYALRRLSESDEVDDLRTRHAEYFRRFIEEQAPHLISAGEAEAIGAIALDHDNLRAALAFCLEHGREATAVHIASALSWYWWGFEPDEGLEWQRKVLPYIDLAEPGAAGTLLAFSALFAGTRRQPEAAALAEQAISRARSAGDHFAEGLGLLARGWISWQASHFDDAKKEGLAAAAIGAEYGYHWLVGQAELYAAFADRMMSRLDGAAEHLAAAEAAFRRQQSPSGLAWCLVLSGQVTRYRFDFDGEIRKQVEARKILAALGDHRSVATTFVNEGIALTLLERPQEAVASGRRGVALEREFGGGDPAEGLVLLGWFEHEANNHDEAFDLFEEALHLAEPALDPYAIDSIAEHLAHLLATLERHDDAARLDGFHQTNLPRPEPEIYAHHYERHRARYRQALGTRTESLLAEGAAMTPQQAHDLGLRAITELRRTR